MDGSLIPREPSFALATRTTVHFHGRLARLFGPTRTIGAERVSSIIRILLITVPGLREELARGRFRLLRGAAERDDAITERMLDLPVGNDFELHIFPVAQGSGGRGIGKDILGAVLIIAAVATIWFAPEIAGATSAYFATAAAGAAVSVGMLGVSLLLGGISEAISPQPGLGSSYLLSGQLNTSAQGAPIPLVYGRCRIGGILVSSSYSAEAYTTATSDYTGFDGVITSPTSGNSGALKSFDSGNPLPSGAMGKGGGKGGGQTSGGIEAPNTLESKAIVRLIFALSEGVVGGFVDGPKSIFFGETPLMAGDGTWNFRGVAYQLMTGTPDQAPVPGFPSVTETNTVGIQIYSGTPVIQTLNSPTATRARITITVPALYAINTQNGDTNPSKLHLQIAVRPSGGTYSTVIDDTINGKCTSPYQKSYVIDLPQVAGVTSWDVEISKITQDSAVATTQNTLYWATYDLITDYQLTYGDTAYMALTLDSEAFGSSLPTVTTELDGIECSVPANYTPATYDPSSNVWTAASYATSGTGTANGTWDGATFKTAVTGNPAWIFYDFVSNDRYGLGLSPSQLETLKYQLYTIGQYADGDAPTSGSTWVMIDDGYGGKEPRYSLNGALSKQTNAFDLMQAIASTFRGMVYWGGGQVGLSADMPKTPVRLLNQADVVNGVFTYQSSSLKGRHTWANVQWQDPKYFYRPAFEPVEYQDKVAERGIWAKDLLGFGVTSRGLARRLGLWMLYTENYQTETMTTTVTWDQMDVMPGDVIAVADSFYWQVRMGGRVRAGASTTAVPLDMEFTPTAGDTYTLLVTYPDGTLSASTAIADFTTVTPMQAPYLLDEANGSGVALPLAATVGGVYGGTLVAEATQPAGDTGAVTVVFGAASGTDAVTIAIGPAGAVSASITAGGATVTLPSATGKAPTTGTRVAVSWTATAFQIAVDGAVIGIINDPAGAPGALTKLSATASGTIALTRATIYGAQRQNDELAALSDPAFDPTSEAVAGTPYSVANLSTALQQAPVAGAVYIIQSTSIEPTQWMVIGIQEQSPGQFALSTVEYDPNKYSIIESGLTFDIPAFANLSYVVVGTLPASPPVNQATGQPTTLVYLSGSSTFYEWVINGSTGIGAWQVVTNPSGQTVLDQLIQPIPAPYNVQLSTSLVGTGTTTVIRLTVSWTAPTDSRIINYQVAVVNSEGVTVKVITANGSTVDIDGLPPDSYQIGMRSLARTGATSAWAYTDLAVTVAGASNANQVGPSTQVTWDVPPPTNLSAAGGFGQVALSWTPSPQRDVSAYEIWRSSTTTTPGASGSVATKRGTAGGVYFVDSDKVNLTPESTWYYWVRAVTTTGVESAFDGPVSASPVFIVSNDIALGAIESQLFANGIQPVALWDSATLPTDPTAVGGSNVLYNAADNTLYRWDASTSTWTPPGTTDASQLTGTLSTNVSVVAASIKSVDLGVTALTGTIPAVNVPDLSSLTGTLSGAQILANSITGNKLAANTVQTTNLAVGSPSNVVWNPSCQISLNGWGNYASSGVTGFSFRLPTETGWFSAIEGAGGLYASSVPSGDAVEAYWSPFGSFVPVVPGQWYEAQVLLNTQRCAAKVQLEWHDSSNNIITANGGTRIVAGNNDGTLNSFELSWVAAQAPANAATVTLLVSAYNDGGSDYAGVGSAPYTAGNSVYVWFCHAQMGETVPNATGPNPYAPGGATSIVGGMIHSQTITAEQIASRTITAGNIQSGTITANEIQGGTITATQCNVQSILNAGTISANQITAGTLSAGVILGSDAFFNNVKIQSADIGNLQVGNAKIAGGSVTTWGWVNYTWTAGLGLSSGWNQNGYYYEVSCYYTVPYNADGANSRLVVFLNTITPASPTGGPGGATGSCFAARAIVLRANGARSRIETILIGDWVRAADWHVDQVMGLDRPVLGERPIFDIDGEHLTTAEHPHLTADKGFVAIDPEEIYREWGAEAEIETVDGVELRRNVGLKEGRVGSLRAGMTLLHTDGTKPVRAIEELRWSPATRLYNLVLSRSGTYFVDGYAVSGWPHEDRFDYDTWEEKPWPS